WAGTIEPHDEGTVATPAEYAALLAATGAQVDVWETTYLHRLTGSNPVLDWIGSTALRPVRDALDDRAYAAFTAAHHVRSRALGARRSRMSKPVLMTVDDDPGVSRAVARDLRRKYGGEFRVVRAESGPDALDALKELTLRGEPTAAILADYRMPGMNGVEFLEQAMDIAPRARRALLTAYADTDAAIRAINVVDVDHYLLKPWEPPEEKLYPVVDALIETWRSVGDRSVEETKVLGHRWSAESFAARDFLARNSVPYRWYNIEEPDGARLLGTAGATADDVPVLVLPDGIVLKSPSEAEIATAVGLTTTPATDF